MEYAMEADPGRLTASFPVFDTYGEAHAASSVPAMYREGIPPVRILVRDAAGVPWRLADGVEEAAA